MGHGKDVKREWISFLYLSTHLPSLDHFNVEKNSGPIYC